ncbi:hypothetical protein HK407_04g08340 [Ordospora pajunii]|uniref:uncharacterized protein n=1 Tax=Ordospora pajunii TaxID=3039483 RepID=UPI002952759A|nr:uncharacterized protein HK407_04g08340 [Ordospora pajunii]KAH9411723.1 hypothetical protein HK407_04g08340 [Ordospora pajunii]
MGNVSSNVSKSPVVARSNSSAPGVLRLYNLGDHIFPYKVSHGTEVYPSIHLATKINEVERLISKHLLLSPRLEEITSREVDIYYNIVNRDSIADDILAKSDQTTPLHYNAAEDGNQMYMCRQFVVELTEEIADAKDLRILQACCNYLTRIPRQIGALINLKVLVLSKNRIRSLPDDIGLLRSLKELNLSQNMLSDLPRGTSSLKILNALHIDNNMFTVLPTVIGRLHGLKYLNVSNNRIQSIPLEILKLPFLIELMSSSCDFDARDIVECVGSPTLKETCSRHLIRNNLNVYRDIDGPLARYILSVQECSFCGGPFFEQYYLHRSMQVFDSERLPVVYKICSRHYSKHEDRIAALFLGPLRTYPERLIRENMPFVSELFNSFGYSTEQTSVLEQGLNNTSSITMPLICLSRRKDHQQEDIIE